MQGFVTSVYDLGCFGGAIITLFVGEKLGRRRTMLVFTVVMGAGKPTAVILKEVLETDPLTNRYRPADSFTQHDTDGIYSYSPSSILLLTSPTGLGKIDRGHRQWWKHQLCACLARRDLSSVPKRHSRRQRDGCECLRFCDLKFHHAGLQWPVIRSAMALPAWFVYGCTIDRLLS